MGLPTTIRSAAAIVGRHARAIAYMAFAVVLDHHHRNQPRSVLQAAGLTSKDRIGAKDRNDVSFRKLATVLCLGSLVQAAGAGEEPLFTLVSQERAISASISSNGCNSNACADNPPPISADDFTEFVAWIQAQCQGPEVSLNGFQQSFMNPKPCGGWPCGFIGAECIAGDQVSVEPRCPPGDPYCVFGSSSSSFSVTFELTSLRQLYLYGWAELVSGPPPHSQMTTKLKLSNQNGDVLIEEDTPSSGFGEYELEVILQPGTYTLFVKAQVGTGICMQVGPGPDDQAWVEVGLEFAETEAEATFITVPINGQFEEALYSDETPVPPAWVEDSPGKFANITQQINVKRQAAGLQPIEQITVKGDWAKLTAPGLRQIFDSRVEYMKSLVLLWPADTYTAYLASKTEANGRTQASSSSRLAAGNIAKKLIAQIKATRQAYGATHPIIVDLVAYSRGGAVASGVLQRLLESGLLSQHAAVSVTYLDPIDPSGPNPDRPSAAAGWLLLDPLIARRANERISHFHAEYACFLPGQPLPGPTFFPISGIEWILNIFAPTFADAFIEEYGYPSGRPRGYLNPDVEGIMTNTTHASLPWKFVAGDWGQVESPPYSLAEFASTSYLGELMRVPLSVIPPLDGFGGPPDGVAGDTDSPSEFLADPTFSDSSEIVEYTGLVLADPGVQALLTEDISYVRADLEQTLADSFPAHSVWQRIGSGVTVGTDKKGQSSATIMGGSTLYQWLDSASLAEQVIGAEIQFEFLDPTGHLTLTFTGDGIDASVTFVEADYPAGVAHTEGGSLFRCSAEELSSPDLVELEGDHVRILSMRMMHATPCPGDANYNRQVNIDDLLEVINAWGPCAIPACCMADIAPVEGNDIVNIDDLLAVINGWGPCP